MFSVFNRLIHWECTLIYVLLVPVMSERNSVKRSLHISAVPFLLLLKRPITLAWKVDITFVAKTGQKRSFWECTRMTQVLLCVVYIVFLSFLLRQPFTDKCLCSFLPITIRSWQSLLEPLSSQCDGCMNPFWIMARTLWPYHC